jgi:hypothetical protein
MVWKEKERQKRLPGIWRTFGLKNRKKVAKFLIDYLCVDFYLFFYFMNMMLDSR